jgi:hypothetical protein
MSANDNPIRDAQDAVLRAIAELRAARVNVPLDLHRAAHALSYAMREPPKRQNAQGKKEGGAARPLFRSRSCPSLRSRPQ